jgi:hypothetical protein
MRVAEAVKPEREEKIPTKQKFAELKAETDVEKWKLATEAINGNKIVDDDTYAGYIGNSASVNRGLRRGFDNYAQLDSSIREIKKMQEDMHQNPTASDVTLYRGLSDDKFLKDLKVGETFTDDAFMSTSPYKDSSFIKETLDMGDSVMRIEAPAGTEGRYVTRKSSTKFYKEEHEVLLQRGSVLQLESITQERKSTVYNFKVVTAKPEALDWTKNIDAWSERDLRSMVDNYYSDRLKRGESREILITEAQTKNFKEMKKADLVTFLRELKWNPLT